MIRHRILFVTLFFFAAFVMSVAQEFKAKVSINTDQLQGVEKELFTELERKLTELINDNRWTNYNFSPAERIICDFAVNILSSEESNKYTAELLVTVQRPVYNASYTTTMLSFRDKNLNFEYQPFDQIVYNPNAFESNLTATIVYYLYFILTLDGDSFSPLGGNVAKNELMQIVNRAGQTNPDWKGWSSFDGTHSRYALAEALNDPAQESFRNYWYIYHRKGLDELVGNMQRGRTNMLENLTLLEETWKARSMSPLLMIFSQAKLKELIQVAEKASASEKKAAYDILNKLYPTEGDILNALKR